MIIAVPIPNKALGLFIVIQTLFLLIHKGIVSAKHLPPGQCPLKIPKEFSSTSPIDLKEKRPPLVAIGHRGSSYNIPEHTLQSYRLALELGADYIEPDLVSTKDGVLVAMHSINLNRTTDVATKFPERQRDIHFDGMEPFSGYFVQDFTVKELKSLRVRQRVEETKARSRLFDWYFSIPTFGEIIDLLYEWNTEIRPLIGRNTSNFSGRSGMYVELKTPKWIQEDANMSLSDLLLTELIEHPHAAELFFGFSNEPNSTSFGCEKLNKYQVPPLVIQCFDSDVLEGVRAAFLTDTGNNFNNANPPLVYLVDNVRCRETEFWYHISGMHITGIGPDKACLLDDTRIGGNNFMLAAEERKLVVHPWTERLENEFIISPRFKTAEEELRYMYCKLGIHGIFAENVDVAVRVGYWGCDDFKSPDELIEKEIEVEEENGDEDDVKKICSQSNNSSLGTIGLACAIMGMLIGALLSFWLTSHYYTKRIHTNSGAIHGSAMVSIPTTPTTP